VKIHIHDVILGDNPSVQLGPPLALDWYNLGSAWYHIDDHEKMNEGRCKRVSRISVADREAMLRSKGDSSGCFDQVFREIDQTEAANKETKQENYRRKVKGAKPPDKEKWEQYKAQYTQGRTTRAVAIMPKKKTGREGS
jgi:hypothetical protein